MCVRVSVCVSECVCVLVTESCLTLCNPIDYIACQAPLSMEFPRQEYWNGLPFPSPGDLPNPGIEPTSPASPALGGRCFATEPQRKPPFHLSPISPLKILSPGTENSFKFLQHAVFSLTSRPLPMLFPVHETLSPKSSSTTLSPS